jgi:curved DNA-binding protein CbpA
MIIKDTYYKILGIEENATKEEIKIKFRSLSLKYHPDKYSGDPDKYLEIKEAYETLHNDETRKVYNLKLFFKGLDFNDEDYELLNKYYNNIINSQEYKLMKLLYESIPKRVKLDLWNRFKGYNKSKQIVKAQKSIDITNLYDDLFINLCISKKDYINNVLKVIFIISNNGIYYLYLRRFDDKIVVDNISCCLTINFYIIN